MRKPLLSDLEQVDPSLLTQEAVGHKNPEKASGRKYGLDASGAGGSRACSWHQAFVLVRRGIAAGTDTTVLCHR